MRALARKIWSESQSASGTIAERYLAGRGIAAISSELRFNARTVMGTGAELQRLPALLAPVTTDTGLVTIQRTFLDPEGSTRKPFNKPKRVLSDPLDGAIRLRPAGPVLGLAEGLEDAASATLWWDVPVWAAMGSERYARLQIPDIVEHVVVFGQNNAASHAGFERARPHLTQRERTCELRTPQGYEDWNDAWRGRVINDA